MASTVLPGLEKFIKGKKGSREEVPVSSLDGEGKVFGLYFSAHWCPPCRGFTPKLAEWYRELKKGPLGEKFDIVFVSSDRDEGAFDEYFDEMPWLALPYGEREKKVGGYYIYMYYICIIIIELLDFNLALPAKA